MKITKRMISLVLSVMIMIMCTSCFSDRGTWFDDADKVDPTFEFDKLKHFSNGIELTLSYDESYYIVSNGTKCTDESIEIPASYNGKPVSEIAESAFEGNKSLKSITIPESVTDIGRNAFYGCDKLEYTVYDNAKYLGSENNPYAFLISSTDEEIETARINESTRVIADFAFVSNKKLASIKLPDSIITVGEEAFNGCFALASVDFGKGVRYIRATAFGNASITEIRLPDSVISIGDNAFAFGREEVEVLELGNSVETIGRGAFDRIIQETLILPDSLRELGNSAFCGCSFKKLIIGDSLKRIEFWTFAHCKQLEEIEFGESVECLENDAFFNCISLREVKLPKSLKSIRAQAFEDCDNLKYSEYGRGRYLGSEDSDYEVLMYLSASYDTALELHPETRLIANNIYYEESPRNQQVQTVTMNGEGRYLRVTDNCVIDPATATLVYGTSNSVIPNDGSVRSIGSYAFYQCYPMEKIILPESLESIGDYAFYACQALSEVEFNSKLKSIGDYAFAYCRELSSPELPEGLELIGEHAFDGCVKLSVIHIPGSVKEIGREAFAMCTGLYKASVGEGVTSLSEFLFHDCNKMTSVTLPSTLKVINNGAFRQCRSLYEIDLPEGLLYIESYAFEYCPKLLEVTLPDSLIGLGEKAFSSCSLTSFTFNKGLREIGNDVIRGIPELAKVKYRGTVEMWKNIENSDNIVRGRDGMKVTCSDGEAVLTPDEYPPEPMW